MAHYCLGRHRFEEGDYDRTVQLMQRALDVDPTIPDALLFIGKSQMHKGDMERAMETLREHLRRAPRSTEGHFQLGQAYAHLNRTEEAVACYQAALALDPQCKNVYYGLSEAYRRLGEAEKARDFQQRFASLAAERAEFVRGMRRGYDDQATMREALANLYAVVGKLYAAAGDNARADEHFRRAAELNAPPPAAKG
jgi:tetratricopeptide (TPR) repeat protein